MTTAKAGRPDVRDDIIFAIILFLLVAVFGKMALSQTVQDVDNAIAKC